jgi:DNA adenine methylase
MQYLQSPVTYHGSKFRLSKQIVPLFPNKINTFVDLFCGSCTVGLNAIAKKIIFNDSQTYLIDMYKYLISKDADEIVTEVLSIVDNFDLLDKRGFLNLRDVYNQNKLPIHLYALMCYSFNNIIRFNSAGNFNAAFGGLVYKGRVFNSDKQKNLKIFIDFLRDVEYNFTNFNFIDFDYIQLNDKDFVYIDPPYLITNAEYNSTWDEKLESELLKICDDLNDRNIKFALSNVIKHKGRTNNMLIDFINNRKYIVHDLNMQYSNVYSKHHTNDNNTVEILLTNYEPRKSKIQNIF